MKNDKVLSAVMKRYGGLSVLFQAMDEDEDVVLTNLEDDTGIDEKEILEVIHKWI
jgi:hypothetical protein